MQQVSTVITIFFIYIKEKLLMKDNNFGVCLFFFHGQTPNYIFLLYWHVAFFIRIISSQGATLWTSWSFTSSDLLECKFFI